MLRAKPQEDKKGGGTGTIGRLQFQEDFTEKKTVFLVHAIVIVIWLL